VTGAHCASSGERQLRHGGEASQDGPMAPLKDTKQNRSLYLITSPRGAESSQRLST
jgi:hypothetical protein